jgi:hypothetical protein
MKRLLATSALGRWQRGAPSICCDTGVRKYTD